MAVSVKRKRSYQTTLRQDQAELTRQRILAAARRLLVSGSYSRVTMKEIAREAGVAYQTLFSAFGSKVLLAQAMVAAGWPHVEDALKLVAESRASGDPVRWLRTTALVNRRINELCGDLVRFMRESGDPDLMSRYRAIELERYARLEELGLMLEKRGLIRENLSRAEAVGIIWAMTGTEQYVQLVLERGWTPDRFEVWLSDALANLILAR